MRVWFLYFVVVLPLAVGCWTLGFYAGSQWARKKFQSALRSMDRQQERGK